MIRKIVAIKNVGRFRNSAAAGNPELAKHTFIVGANGYGKTTICAILRSLKIGDPSQVLGRRTLGVTDAPSIELLLASGLARFDGTTWNSTHPELAIFDGAFVAENVHSGEVVEIDHRRNLYRVIIGEEGVHLATEEARRAAESRDKANEISGIGKAIQLHIPAGMKLEAFLTLPAAPDIDARIAEQERTVEAARQAKHINEREAVLEITIPVLPEGFSALLARTLDDIAEDAEARLAEHLAAHGMAAAGGNWIAMGLDHAEGETCPFCGRDIRGLPLISAYRAVFSDRYKALRDEISAMRAAIAEDFGEGGLGRLNTRAEQNRGAVEFWSRYCAFDPAPLAFPESVCQAICTLAKAAFDLLDRKRRAPLEPVHLDEAFTAAKADYNDAGSRVQALAEHIRAANALIAAKKQETGTADIRAAEAELARRRAIKVRHDDSVAALCADHVRLTGEKAAIESRKAEIRAQLDEHTRNVVQPYERRINDFLEAFNANFRIAQTRHGYPGGIAASSYQLVINNTAIELGDGRTPTDRPSFRNTLSAGDRTTLALAFFLSHLERDPALSTKIIVFDDPFSSQDAFRRRQTVHEIMKVAARCVQVIVLSHDATFLKQLWNKTLGQPRTSLRLDDRRNQGMKIIPCDLEKACQGRTANDIDDLLTYLASGAGVPIDIIRKMRVVLETHCRTTYTACFSETDWLGDMVRKIRDDGEDHPASALYGELDQINSYTSQYHHGENLNDITPDDIDPDELTGFTKRTLRIVNALQA